MFELSCFVRCEDDHPAEMFDNPLYGTTGKSRSTKDQEPPRKDQLPLPELFAFPKPEPESERAPPVPSPRNRSFTCSETKPHSTSPTPPGGNVNTLHPQSFTKKPVVPSRSDGGAAMLGRPPLPSKSRPGQTQEPQPKVRDYRDTSELPGKMRPPPRPIQPLPKDGTGQTIQRKHTSKYQVTRTEYMYLTEGGAVCHSCEIQTTRVNLQLTI